MAKQGQSWAPLLPQLLEWFAHLPIPLFSVLPDGVMRFLQRPKPKQDEKKGVKGKGREAPGFTPLHLASQSGHANPTRSVVEQGIDVTIQDKDGSTPLHQASQGGDAKITLILLQCGADANARDEDNTTPLHRASESGHLEVAQTLLMYGAHANTSDESDCTPLHFASQEGHLEVVRLLLDHCKDKGAFPMTSEQNHALIRSLLTARTFRCGG